MTRFEVFPLPVVCLAAALWLLAAAAAANELDPDRSSSPSATPPVAAEAPAADAAAPAPRGQIARAGFASAVVEREPRGPLGSLPDGLERVFFFSELEDLAGSRVLHRWEHEGRVVAEVPFEVGGPRWRVHSSKRLGPGDFGRWTVRVIDAEGRLLHHQSIAHESPASEVRGGRRPLPPASMLD